MNHPQGAQSPDDPPQDPAQPQYPMWLQLLPTPAGPLSSRKAKAGLVIALVTVLGIVVAAAITAAALLTAEGKGPFAADDKRIELAIHDFYNTLGANGFQAAAAKACAADRADFAALPEQQRRQFAATKVDVTIDRIDNIVITGNKATAHITGRLTLTMPGQEPDTDTATNERLTKEDGTWKVCSGQSSKN
ncbi:hypothetical protein [Nocardia arthritidis]|uniref:Uncharacterized protein n=1 Tax=Nocardia arthritidis TaxID=228602 RepID=A0A6G9Y8A5_9NOCA|nr:hypothetical protein [Nocardia arthritidis]QIS09350.1 hypothetical protein F5544_07215 [Nocardia arthritidis]